MNYWYDPINYSFGYVPQSRQLGPQVPSRTDFGPRPYVVNIEQATLANQNYRTALWTGRHLQLTLMSIPVGESIGLEIHPSTDQFIRLEEGQARVMMGQRREVLDFQQDIRKDDAIFVPAGTWHNVVNTGNTPMKLYTIYAPPHHPYGTIERTKEEAQMHRNTHLFY